MFRQLAESQDGARIDFGHGDGRNPVSKARAKRRDLGERYLKQLRSLLTAEQREKVSSLEPAPSGPVQIRRVIGPDRRDD